LDSIGLIPAFVRPGFDDLQPFEETVTRRVGNLKAVGRQISLRAPTTPADNALISAAAIVEFIHDIPPQYEREKLSSFIAEYFKKSLEKNKELATYVKSFDESKGTPDEREEASEKLVSSAARYSSEHLDEALKQGLSNFMTSDFPLALFDELSLFQRAYTRFLSTAVDARGRMFARVSMAHRSRGLEGSKAQLRDFKDKIAPLLVATDLAWLSYVSIQVYIDLKHSSNYEDLFVEKDCSIEKLDRPEYERLFLELAKNNDNLRQELTKFIPRGMEEQRRDVSNRVRTIWLEMNQLRADSSELKA
jgi:hypothetical protein